MLPVSPVKIPLAKSGSITVAAISSAMLNQKDEKAVPSAAEKKEEKAPEAVVADRKTAVSKAEVKAEDTKKVYHPDADVKKYESAMKAGKAAEAKKDYSMALWHYWQAADAGVQEAAPYMALAKLNIKRDERAAAEKAYKTALKYGAERDGELEKIFEKEAEVLPSVEEDSMESRTGKSK